MDRVHTNPVLRREFDVVTPVRPHALSQQLIHPPHDPTRHPQNQ